MVRQVAVQYGPKMIPISIRLPMEAKQRFDADDRTVSEMLKECEEQGLMSSKTMVPYQFHEVLIPTQLPREIAEQLYRSLPLGADTTTVARLCGLMIARHYGITISPRSGRLATSEDGKLMTLIAAVERGKK